MTPEEARALFPVLGRVAYLNAGTFGPLATPTRDAVAAAIERAAEDGRSGMAMFEHALADREALRAELAELVGASPEQVALTTSTTDACNLVVGGLGLEPGDEVVTTTDEHFGLLGPLGASSARVVVVEPDADAVLAAVTPRTRLLALSQVLWTTGAVLPLAELRRRTGIPVLADGAQSVGAIPVELDGLDFLTVSGQKWLCGPDTTGALVVADPERLRVAAPSYFAQSAYAPDGTFTARPGAARFDSGWWPPGSVAGLLAAVRLRPEWAFDRAAAIAETCRAALTGLVDLVAPAARATLVSFRVDASASAGLVAALAERGVLVRDLPGRGLVRVSCGWWTDEDDIERLVRALGDVLR